MRATTRSESRNLRVQLSRFPTAPATADLVVGQIPGNRVRSNIAEEESLKPERLVNQ